METAMNSNDLREIQGALTRARVASIRKRKLKHAAFLTALIACLFFWHLVIQWVRS